MFACPLCSDWLYVRSLCPKCLPIKKIVDIYGVKQVSEAVETIFLREDDKVENKVKHEARRGRSKTRHEGIKGLDGEK